MGTLSSFIVLFVRSLNISHSGIGTTVKNMLGSEQTTEEQGMSQTRNEPSSLEIPDNVLKEPSTLAPHQLPSGTGPGTLGKPSTNLASEQEVERNRVSQGIAGYGTDATAAAGGSLEGTHMGASSKLSITFLVAI